MQRVLRAFAARGIDIARPTSAAAELLGYGVTTITLHQSSCGAAAMGTPRSCMWLTQLAQAPHESLLPHAVRHYAKAAKGGGSAAAAPAAKAGPKRFRTSETKLYSCRNDRLRHTHEQIWPTLQLTDAELNMFRRNSRLYVVDMGKSISLQTKYRLGQLNPAEHMGAAASEDAGQNLSTPRVPYQQARNLLYESQMHLDALGENPRYLKIRQVRSQFSAKLQNMRKLRLLLGFQRRKTLQHMYEHALLSPGSHRMWKMVCAMEANLAMFVTRMGLADDSVAAVYAVDNHKLYVNGRHPAMPRKGYLLPGDVVGPSAGATSFFRKRVAKSLESLEGEVIRGIL